MLGLSNNIQFASVQRSIAVTFETEYQTVYDSFTNKPSESVAIAQNALVKSLKDNGIWSKLDSFFVFAQESNAANEALTDWKDITRIAVVNGGMAFTSLEGFLGLTAGTYINTGYNPFTDATNYLQDSCSIIVYSRTDVNTADDSLWGMDASGSYFKPLNATQFRVRVNTSANVDFAHTGVQGCHVCVRSGDDTIKVYKNSSSVLDTANLDTAISNANFIVGAQLTTYGYSANQFSFWGAGATLSPTEVANLTTAMEAYMDSNGKGVIA